MAYGLLYLKSRFQPLIIFKSLSILISYPIANVLRVNTSPTITLPKDHTFLVFYVFLLIFANANQVTSCRPNEDCLLNCTKASSCSSITINATQSTSLSIYCTADSSCEYSTILCPKSVCSVTCDGAYSCSDTIIHSNLSSALHIHCNHHRACFLSTIFGPQSSVHIDCSADRSCVSSTFYLNSTPNVTIRCYHTQSSDYDNACSTNSFYVNNASYAYFMFEANSTHAYEGGMSNVIYGMHIYHILSIQCNGFKCARDLDVYCPIDAECIFITDENEIIASSLDIVHFFIPNDLYNNLKIECRSALGICSSVDQRIVHCLDTDETSVVAFDSIDHKWYCFIHENHCCPANLIKNNTSKPIYCDDTDCIINCSIILCAFMTINAKSSTSLTVYCDSNYACQGSHIMCASSICNIVCTESYACQYLLVEAESLRTLNIDCISAHYECQYITINAHLTYDANIRIACGNEGSTHSCIWSNFTFQAIRDPSIIISVQVDITCIGAYACQYSSWYMIQMNTVSIDCISRDACESSIVDAITSSQLNILCDGRQACYNNDIRCPSHSIHSCVIQCSDYARSCRYLGITSVEKYANQYLDIECPINPKSNYVCTDIHTHCAQDETLMTYDEIYGVLQCSDTTCCPLIPSQSPTNEPTLFPTMDPTMNPTINPTFMPTMDPTTEPTLNPTAFPTYIPTREPSIEPTMNPTDIPTIEPSVYPAYDLPQTSLYPTINSPTINSPTWIPSSRPNYGPTVDPFATLKPSGLSKRATMIPTSSVNVVWITSTSNVIETKDEAEISTHDIRDKAEPIYIVLALILLFNIVLLICIFRYNLNRRNQSFYVDDQEYIAVVLYCVQMFDLYSDIILSSQLYAYHIHSSMDDDANESRSNALYTLFVASVIFIVIPYIANFCSSIFIVVNIMNNKMIHLFTKQYFRDYGVLYIVGVILGGGSFGTLQLLNTDLLGIRQLHCGLSSFQLQQFTSHKLYCSTLLQNIPNFLIQLYFIVELNVVTHTVILSNVTTLFNMLLNVCIAIIVYITRTSKDKQEIPFSINVSWTARKDEEQKADVAIVSMHDPYHRFGYRQKLSLTLSGLYNAMQFEVLSSQRNTQNSNDASIYGVMKLDRVSRNKRKQIEMFLNGKKALTAAIINAFGYEPYFTDKYEFRVSVEHHHNAVKDRSIYISKEMQQYLPQIWQGMKRDTIGISDEIFNQLDAEIQRLNEAADDDDDDDDEGYDEAHTYDAHNSINMEMEMKKNLYQHIL